MCRRRMGECLPWVRGMIQTGEQQSDVTQDGEVSVETWTIPEEH